MVSLLLLPLLPPKQNHKILTKFKKKDKFERRTLVSAAAVSESAAATAVLKEEAMAGIGVKRKDEVRVRMAGIGREIAVVALLSGFGFGVWKWATVVDQHALPARVATALIFLSGEWFSFSLSLSMCVQRLESRDSVGERREIYEIT